MENINNEIGKIKKLIYPLKYSTHEESASIMSRGYGGGFFDLESGLPADTTIYGNFEGIDVRTKNKVNFSTYQYCSYYFLSDGDLSEFSENDILFMERLGISYSIAENKPSFEEVYDYYKQLKDEGISDEEINSFVIEHFNNKQKSI